MGGAHYPHVRMPVRTIPASFRGCIKAYRTLVPYVAVLQQHTKRSGIPSARNLSLPNAFLSALNVDASDGMLDSSATKVVNAGLLFCFHPSVIHWTDGRGAAGDGNTKTTDISGLSIADGHIETTDTLVLGMVASTVKVVPLM